MAWVEQIIQKVRDRSQVFGGNNLITYRNLIHLEYDCHIFFKCLVIEMNNIENHNLDKELGTLNQKF